jgi:hypothetical protein
MRSLKKRDQRLTAAQHKKLESATEPEAVTEMLIGKEQSAIPALTNFSRCTVQRLKIGG